MIRARLPLTPLLALLLIAGPTAQAGKPGENTKELVEKLEESRKSVADADAQKRRIMGTLYVINKRMKKISREKNHLTDELFQTEDSVKTLAKLIATLESEIEQERKQLKARLRALYKLSGEGFVGILFSHSSASDFDETLRFLKIVTDSDYQLIKSYQKNVAIYKKQKNKLRAQVSRLVSIQKNIKRQEGLLAAEHKQKSIIANELDRSRTVNLDRLKSLRSKTRQLAESGSPEAVEFGDLLQDSIYENKGQLHSPLQVPVAQGFGLKTDDRYKIRLSHKGWRFGASPGAKVTAIFNGTVIHSEPVRGYGHTVILDHGDHYYSLYSNVQNVKPRLGEQVKRGDSFAEATLAGGVYFEIRHFSEPENPTNWIVKTENQNANLARSKEEPDREESL